jgi:hypothetical protein
MYTSENISPDGCTTNDSVLPWKICSILKSIANCLQNRVLVMCCRCLDCVYMAMHIVVKFVTRLVYTYVIHIEKVKYKYRFVLTIST